MSKIWTLIGSSYPIRGHEERNVFQFLLHCLIDIVTAKDEATIKT